jgi:inorganic pyrophosphatase/exopolyphosphatase
MKTEKHGGALARPNANPHMEEAIHVIGHKNADTDSICPAIGCAHLWNALGDSEVRPARAGEGVRPIARPRARLWESARHDNF